MQLYGKLHKRVKIYIDVALQLCEIFQVDLDSLVRSDLTSGEKIAGQPAFVDYRAQYQELKKQYETLEQQPGAKETAEGTGVGDQETCAGTGEGDWVGVKQRDVPTATFDPAGSEFQ